MNKVVPDQERILRVFFGLLDLSRDLERNDDDGLFRAEGGTIHYALDADLFEVFIQPWDPRRRSVSLHGDEWSMSRESRPADWKAVSIQTALSATEYLVSGMLPGQRDQKILMTFEHRWELARRTEALADKYAGVLVSGQPDEGLARFQEASEIRECLGQNADCSERIAQFDSLLWEDVQALKASGVDNEALASFAGTRATIKALARDRKVEPAEQVERLVGPHLRQRFMTLHQQFPIRQEEQKAISQDARRWFGLLQEEARLQKIHIFGEGDTAKRGRSRAALWDDACSLATLRWIALRHVGSKSRLVFVTADDLLFDTYRRWYANLLPSDIAYSEPFVLRRLMQFAPMFNLADSGRMPGKDARQVFQDMRHLLEINLLTLNLSRLNNRLRAEPILTRMRELTALRRRDDKPISTDLSYKTLAAALKEKDARGELSELGEVLDNLRVLERFSLGQVDDHVRRRLTERQATLLGLNEKGGDERSMLRYVGNLVHKMLAVSARVWLPLARDFIDAWRPRPGQKLIRAPIAIRLKILVDGILVDVGGTLHARLYQDADAAQHSLFNSKEWDQFENDEAVVFAIAAVLALASDDWGNAEHFSERAQRAQRARTQDTERLAEYEYIAALAKRFRIGSQGVPRSGDALGKIVRLYRAALEGLNWCIELHRDGTDGEAQVVRLLRSLSERAALHLFFGSVLIPRIEFGDALRGGRLVPSWRRTTI